MIKPDFTFLDFLTTMARHKSATQILEYTNDSITFERRDGEIVTLSRQKELEEKLRSLGDQQVPYVYEQTNGPDRTIGVMMVQTQSDVHWVYLVEPFELEAQAVPVTIYRTWNRGGVGGLTSAFAHEGVIRWHMMRNADVQNVIETFVREHPLYRLAFATSDITFQYR